MFYFSQFVFYFVLWIGNKGLWKKTQFHRFPLSVKVLFLLGFFILWSVFFWKNSGGYKTISKVVSFFSRCTICLSVQMSLLLSITCFSFFYFIEKVHHQKIFFVKAIFCPLVQGHACTHSIYIHTQRKSSGKLGMSVSYLFS